MSPSLAEWRELRAIDKQMRRSDPRLASALALFALLASSEPRSRHERLRAQAWRLRAVPLRVISAVSLVIHRIATIARRKQAENIVV